MAPEEGLRRAAARRLAETAGRPRQAAVRTAAVPPVTVGDGTGSPAAARPASYAGLAPTARLPGGSVHGGHAPGDGSRQLKQAMFPSVLAALHDPASRACHDTQHARKKTRTQVPLRLARHRVSVLFTMLRAGTSYAPRSTEAVIRWPLGINEGHEGTSRYRLMND
jgi:Transposase IS116/IS110/IS902 family